MTNERTKALDEERFVKHANLLASIINKANPLINYVTSAKYREYNQKNQYNGEQYE